MWGGTGVSVSFPVLGAEAHTCPEWGTPQDKWQGAQGRFLCATRTKAPCTGCPEPATAWGKGPRSLQCTAQGLGVPKREVFSLFLVCNFLYRGPEQKFRVIFFLSQVY